MYLVTADEMRRMDHDTIEHFGLPGRLLMENAGRGATRMLLETFPEIYRQKVGVIAGRGNNGGDGFVIARYLHEYGVAVTVFLLSDSSRVQGDARANLELLPDLPVPVIALPDEQSFRGQKSLLQNQDLWVDAILGTGLRLEVKGYYQEVIEFVNQTGKPVFAMDIPSGLNADTGQICGVCIKADATATFAYPKIGHLTYPGADFTGRLAVVDIGIPEKMAEAVKPRQFVLTPAYLESICHLRSSQAHKGDTGHLLILAGSPGKTGAAVLVSTAAMRCGAGLVSLGVPAGLNPVLESQVTEVMTIPLDQTDEGLLSPAALEKIRQHLEGKKCLAIGPGLGVSAATSSVLFDLLQSIRVPVVIDADGLTLLADNKKVLKTMDVPVILTPHPGEMARLVNAVPREIQQDRIAVARAFAREFNVHLVLKGAATVIAHPDGTVYLNPTGNPGMASGGMGDVLTGLISGLVTQGYPPETATHLGVWIHGAAADRLAETRGAVGYLASDLTGEIPSRFSDLLDGQASHPDRLPFVQEVF